MPKVKVLRRSAYEASHEDHRERTRVIVERAIRDGQNEFLICRDVFRERYWMASLYPAFRGEVVLTAQIKPLCSVLFELSATQRCILYHLGRGWPIARVCDRYNVTESALRETLQHASDALGGMQFDATVAWAGRMSAALMLENLEMWR